MHLLSSNYFLLPSYYKERSKPFKKSIFFSVSSNFFLIPFPISSISFSWIILINIHILHTLSYLLCFFLKKKNQNKTFPWFHISTSTGIYFLSFSLKPASASLLPKTSCSQSHHLSWVTNDLFQTSSGIAHAKSFCTPDKASLLLQ